MMRAFAGLSAAGFALLVSQSAFAAGQCGPLQRIISVDTVVGPGGYMLVPVKLGDAQRLMLFDTGGAINGVTQQTAQELHLSTYESRVGLVGINGAKSNRATTIPSVTIGTAETKSAQYMILPNSMPAGIAGVLAPAAGVDIDLDFAGRKLSFFSTDHCDGKVVYWAAQAVAVVPMRVAGADPRAPARLGNVDHIIIPVTLDGKQFDALIDTGATTNVLNQRVAADRLGVDVSAPDVQQVGQFAKAPSEKIYRKRFGTLAFEGVTITNPVLDLVPDTQTRALGDERQTGSLTRPTDRGLPDLIIGMPILSKTHMYIAYRERKVYITGAETAQVQTASLTQPTAGSNFSGSWKIASQPVRPVCEITQTGNELTGSCVGAAAKGEVAGTVAGQTVRWQWKRVANNDGATSLWNFSGTIAADNSITGFIEQNGRSAAFTATKQ